MSCLLHIHIGHDFFGAGNIGDDWMLAGFLGELRRTNTNVRLTCCSPHDTEALRHRFPEVEWHLADSATRQSLITDADVWLGLGGTPFQTHSTTYFLDYIAQDVTWARQASVPVYFLGVGVEDTVAAAMPQTRFILERTKRIWTRDALSAQLLKSVGTTAEIIASSDLAHLFFSGLAHPKIRGRSDGLVINVEKSNQVSAQALNQFVVSYKSKKLLWIAQERRALSDSEMTFWGRFTDLERDSLELCVPDYKQGTPTTFVEPYDRLNACLTTRYHSALAAAWRGAAVTIFTRSQKLEGLLQQLPLGRCATLDTVANFKEGLNAAQSVSPSTLHDLAANIRHACESFFLELELTRKRTPKKRPSLTWDFGTGWYSEESADEHTWRWASDQAIVAIRANEPNELVLGGMWRVLTAPNIVTIDLPDGTIQRWDVSSPGFHPPPKTHFHIPAGLSLLRFHVSVPAIQPPGDSRHLALAWRNPAIHVLEQERAP